MTCLQRLTFDGDASPTIPTNMPIRYAHRSDVPVAADIIAAAISSDELGPILFPNREQHPEAVPLAFLQYVQPSYWDYSKVMLVSYAKPDEAVETLGNKTTRSKSTRSQQGQIVTGVAIWSRVGIGWERVWNVWGWWDPRLLLTKIFQVWQQSIRFFHRNKASPQPTSANPDPLTIFNFGATYMPFIAHHFQNPPWRRTHWRLAALSVDPRYHGLGHGRELVAWGLNRAREEGLPASVIAAKGKERFYGNCGFELLVGWFTEGPDKDGNKNPLAEVGIEGGAVLWTRVKEDENSESLEKELAAQREAIARTKNKT